MKNLKAILKFFKMDRLELKKEKMPWQDLHLKGLIM